MLRVRARYGHRGASRANRRHRVWRVGTRRVWALRRKRMLGDGAKTVFRARNGARCTRHTRLRISRETIHVRDRTRPSFVQLTRIVRRLKASVRKMEKGNTLLRYIFVFQPENSFSYKSRARNTIVGRKIWANWFENSRINNDYLCFTISDDLVGR